MNKALHMVWSYLESDYRCSLLISWWWYLYAVHGYHTLTHLNKQRISLFKCTEIGSDNNHFTCNACNKIHTDDTDIH